MHAILHLTLSDDVVIEPATTKQPGITRKVEVMDKMELNIDVTYDEFKRAWSSSVAATLGSLLDHAFTKFETAGKTVVLAAQEEKMAAAEKAAAEAKTAAIKKLSAGSVPEAAEVKVATTIEVATSPKKESVKAAQPEQPAASKTQSKDK
jgi:hypothetical protein